MRLRPQQVAGLVAVIAFGGILMWTLMAPKRDPFAVPGTIKLTGTETPTQTPVTTLPAETIATAPSADSLTLGTDEAKDDLYCAGVLNAAVEASADRASPEAATRRGQFIALAKAGAGKLVASGAATWNTSGTIVDAQVIAAGRDVAAGTPRLSLESCTARAMALPPT